MNSKGLEEKDLKALCEACEGSMVIAIHAWMDGDGSLNTKVLRVDTAEHPGELGIPVEKIEVVKK
jgi:hypothetical protein